MADVHDFVKDADCISRQAAIDSFPEDALAWDISDGYIAPHYARKILEQLPSAESELIRCKDCKYSSDDEYCHCSKVTWWNSENDFCSKGTRRTG